MHILRFNGFYNEEEDYFRVNNTQLASYLRSVGNELPDWIINLSTAQSKLLLDSLLVSGTYTTAIKKNANLVQILAINAGEPVVLSLASNIYTITGSKSEPLVSSSDESVISYDGLVYGLTIPNNIFMVRRGGKYCWIGSA
jgi:triacylglycerol esterase/lipase EstA (alpha/beta hydrolase family)